VTVLRVLFALSFLAGKQLEIAVTRRLKAAKWKPSADREPGDSWLRPVFLVGYVIGFEHMAWLYFWHYHAEIALLLCHRLRTPRQHSSCDLSECKRFDRMQWFSSSVCHMPLHTKTQRARSQ